MTSTLQRISSFLFAAMAALSTVAGDHGMALPRHIYQLPGRCAHYHTQAFVSHAQSQQGHYLRVDGSCPFVCRLPAVTTIAPAADGQFAIFSMVDAASFAPLESDTVTLHIGTVPPTSPRIQIIGDSFVQGAFYRTALVDSAMAGPVQLVGLRRLAESDCQCDEGRGGWTLAQYFTITKGAMNPYSGFMQPADGRRYLGDCCFWQNCHKVHSGLLTDFESRYQCGRYDHLLDRFDPATGLAAKPAKGDLMYDSHRQCYLLYNGRRWTAIADEDESTWTFDYAKYLDIWGIEAPDYLFETLGLNDYRNILEADYSQWDTMLRQMHDSYLKANPKGRFAIVLPCSSCGSLNNRRGDFTTRQNECMWRLRRHIIDTFDGSPGYDIVDMGITIDNENGYRRDSEGLQTGNPHPYPNYPAMGEPLAAYICYWETHKQR